MVIARRVRTKERDMVRLHAGDSTESWKYFM